MSSIFVDHFWKSLLGYFIIFVTTRMLAIQMREIIIDESMYYDAALSNGGISSYLFAIMYGLFGTCLIRALMTKAFLAQISAEECNKKMLKILNNFPEAVLLLTKT
jgi:hypothetical protein